MAVTDDQVAALRAQLSGDRIEHERLLSMLDGQADRDGYAALIGAAFVVASERRFRANGTAADVIRFVADVRSRTPSAAERIDPKIGERLVLCALTDEPIDDIDADTAIVTQLLLLVGLIADAEFESAGLDAFLAESRALADEWMS